MAVLYGRLGLIADIGLVIYGLLTLAIYKLIPITLTLPGIAGFILSVGMAVDANILIFERMKEELVSPEELDKAKNGIWGRMLFYRLSRVNQAYFMSVNEFKEVGYDYDEKYIKHIRKVTADEVKQAAEKYLDTQNYVLAVVGKT